MKKPKLSDKVKIRKEFDEYLMYQPGRGLTLLNQTGYEIISRCDGRNTIEDIAENISRKYNTDAEAIGKDVREFVEKFGLMGVILYE